MASCCLGLVPLRCRSLAALRCRSEISHHGSTEARNEKNFLCRSPRATLKGASGALPPSRGSASCGSKIFPWLRDSVVKNQSAKTSRSRRGADPSAAREGARALFMSVFAVLLVVLAPTTAEAQPAGVPPELQHVGVTEHLDGQLPLATPFRDHTGKPVELGTYFDGKRPVV